MTAEHYENFPVGSWVLPKPLRAPVHALYAFCRTADDIADEGNAAPAVRLAQLAALVAELDRMGQGLMPQTPLMQHLLQTAVAPFALPLAPFYDLLSAFSQDVTVSRYADETALLNYCARSANPVGRLMLALFGVHGDMVQTQSDAICTALQLINFCQDVVVDWQKGRVYLPQEEMRCYGVTEDDLAAGRFTTDMQALMAHQALRAQRFLDAGAPLGRALPGRIGWELRLIVAGGQRVLSQLHQVRYNVIDARVRLYWWDVPGLLWQAARYSMSSGLSAANRLGS